MIDIIIIFCCVLGGFAVGKYFENNISTKGKFYRDLLRYILQLRDNVNGRQLELHRFNEEFAQSACEPFATFLQFGKITVKLNKQQKQNFNAFFDNISCSSSQALLQHLDYYAKLLEADGNEVINTQIVKSSIYSKLGMLLGVMIGILLV